MKDQLIHTHFRVHCIICDRFRDKRETPWARKSTLTVSGIKLEENCLCGVFAFAIADPVSATLRRCLMTLLLPRDASVS